MRPLITSTQRGAIVTKYGDYQLEENVKMF
jgi:hypothetical protein